MEKQYKIINGNNIEVLDSFESNSIDSIITDPPYELGFMGKEWDRSGIAYNVELWRKALKVLKPGGFLLAFGGTRTYHRLACAIEDAGFYIKDCIMWLYGSGFPKSKDLKKATGDQKWEGWGTCLKPAYEPIIVAQKPVEKTIINNVLKHDVGGINIDECRVETDGRFPANVILTYDDTDKDEVCGGMPYTKGDTRESKPTYNKAIWGNATSVESKCLYNDEGSAARYFYSAKASKKDRDEGLEFHNLHPTVKPTSLMQYLVRLVSPKGAIILDIFNGSGSTGKAVAFENRERGANYKYIGIELDPEYCKISKARIDYALSKYKYEEIKLF